jgi:hypothetical protein
MRTFSHQLQAMRNGLIRATTPAIARKRIIGQVHNPHNARTLHIQQKSAAAQRAAGTHREHALKKQALKRCAVAIT